MAKQEPRAVGVAPGDWQDRIEAFAGICRDVIATASFQEALDRTVEMLVDRLGYFCASVGLTEPSGRSVVNRAWSARIPLDVPEGYRQDIGAGIVARAIAERRAVLVPDVRRDPDYIPLFEQVRSEICMPLVAGDEVIGILDVNSEEVDGFPERDRRLLETLAGHLAQILDKNRLLHEVVETRDYLEGLIEAAGDAIVTADMEGRIQRWNGAAERMFGRTRDEVLGKPVRSLWPPEEAAAAERLFRDVTCGTGVQNLPVRRTHQDGHAVEVLLTLSPIRNAAGEIVGVSSILRDISEQVRMEGQFVDMHRRVSASEEKYRSLVENAQEAIFLVDRRGLSIREANPCAVRLTQRPRERLEKMRWPELAGDDESVPARRHLEVAARTGSAPPREFRIKRPDDRPLVLEITATDVKAGGERFLQVIGRDVTSRRQSEAEHEALRNRLVQSEKLSVMGELLGGVAHELNNPLTGVIGYAQLLLNQKCDDKLRRNLDRIQEEARRCHRIVQSLLTFSRQRTTERRRVMIHEVLEETLDLRAYPMRVDNIWVVKDFHPDLPSVEGDAHQLQQVFMNLITNAHQSMASTGLGGVLTVATRPLEDHVEIRFSDNGPGVPEAIRRKIFEPFFTTKGVGQGTGLGLSICYGILQDHKGQLSVSSRPGVETCFVIELPIGPARTHEVPDASAEMPEARGPAAPGEVKERPRRILVVDDEDSIREFLGEALRVRGHSVDTVANGLMALDRLRESRYEAVITDLKMPCMNGRQLYEALCRGYPEVAERVIFTTGDLVAKDTMEFLRGTGNMYLEKPFSIRSVAEALQGLEN